MAIGKKIVLSTKDLYPEPRLPVSVVYTVASVRRHPVVHPWAVLRAALEPRSAYVFK